MAEYIDRETLLEEIEQQKRASKSTYPRRSFVVGDVLACIRNAPLADVLPVVHGKWEEVTDTVQDILRERPPYLIVRGYKCSVCGRFEKNIEPYCNCGAKMEGGQHEI